MAASGLRLLFFGLICGAYTCAAIWLLIDQLDSHTGNIIRYAS